MKLSIIIPAHNEEKRIGRTLNEYCKFLRNRKQDFEILVVLNACRDNTLSVVKKYKKKFKEISFLNFKQGGKGFAIIEGFKDALKRNNDLIGFADADMATPPMSFYELIENINNYDGIIASRYVKGSIVKPKQPFIRILASRVFNILVRSLFLFNYRDTQCGGKLFKRRVIEDVIDKFSISQWAFDIDLLYNVNKSRFRIKEFPIFWRDVGGSKINLKKASIQMFLSVIQLRILNSKLEKGLKFFGPIVKPLYKTIR